MKSRLGRWPLAAAGVLVGALLLSPVTAHVNNNFGHLWNDHIKPKADQRYTKLSEDLWARINSDATIQAGEGVVDVNDEGDGSYLVVFNRNIRRCAQVVTTRNANLIASAQPLGPNTAATEVSLVNTLNNGVDAAFSIIVRC